MPGRALPAFVPFFLVTACGAPTSTPPASPAIPAAPQASGSPRYRSVHIDTLAPERFAQFEAGRRAWVEELRRAGVTDGRGVFVQVDADRFYTLRPFSAFASFDTRIAAINAALAHVPKEAAERYDRDSDTALVFPHASEIWEVDDDLSYLPAEGALTEATAAVGRLVLEDVRPDPASEDRYASARGEINKALAEARYPLTLRSFRCVYGAGHTATFLLAPSREALDAAPPADAVVARLRGAPRAAELSAAVDASVAKRETHALVVRHDLTWP